tara:strand:- start:62626 stop:63198 length:573 start_codon:yes stop_codon:yes gene_type:complete
MSTQISELSLELRERMRGVSWHADLPSPSFDELRVLRIPYRDFSGDEQLGELITVKALAAEVVDIFAGLFAIDFPIFSMRLMHEFAGDDGDSMAANNSSCFNSRRIRNTNRISLHALGRAIDINPIQNPVIRDGIVRPDAGKPYCDRSRQEPGMFSGTCDATKVFLSAGWKWGGNWDNPKDYHHFFREAE